MAVLDTGRGGFSSHGCDAQLLGAASTGDLATLRRRLALGADPNSRDEHGRTPLMHAIPGGVLGLRMLLEHGADVQVRDASGLSPLQIALSCRANDAALLLLEHGAAIDVADRHGNTPLHDAIVCCSHMQHGTELVERLLARGADPRRPNAHGVTAAMLADRIADCPFAGRL